MFRVQVQLPDIVFKNISTSLTSTQQNTTAPQPQHSSTPIQLDDAQQQNVEHDSSSHIENEPEREEASETKEQQLTQSSNQATESKAPKLLEQSPISSLDTEDIEELEKLILD